MIFMTSGGFETILRDTYGTREDRTAEIPDVP
jgi:hypothetical protein